LCWDEEGSGEGRRSREVGVKRGMGKKGGRRGRVKNGNLEGGVGGGGMGGK